MSLRRPDPLRDLLTLQERMNRLFEQSLARLDAPVPDYAHFSPAADVFETAEGYVVELELPGVRDEDVEIVADEHRLFVRGVRRQLEGLRPDGFHRVERAHGAFNRHFEFAAAIDPDAVRATFEDGVLRVELPRRGRGPHE
ncbi:MAG: Hsp20/alpha crystallin family protein [Vicinamibacteria bacterium]|nr:Hsp20/alpha crystallin family protein [Vicinamibacteria bacterium]